MLVDNAGIGREPVSFMAGENRLYGVLHRPESDSGTGQGVVLLSAGMKNRTGYARLYVALADYLAGQGIPALRFDYHGCGDSDGRHEPTGAWEEKHADINEQVLTGSLADDVKAAVAEFKRQTDCTEVLLFGLCSGANTAIYAADQIGDVGGVVLANLPVAIDSSKRRESRQGEMNLFQQQFMFEAYLRKIFSPRAWARFLGGQSDFKSIFYLVKKKFFGGKSLPKPERENRTKVQSAPSDDGFDFNFDMLERFESFWKSGRPVYFFFSENDPIRVNFETYFEGKHGTELMKRHETLCHKVIFKDANHSFVNTEWREELFRRVAQCASKETAWPTQARQ
jgi:pimeloyl-ACP methyl ester carboxylesterase